jgi:hypothetical protein
VKREWRGAAGGRAGDVPRGCFMPVCVSRTHVRDRSRASLAAPTCRHLLAFPPFPRHLGLRGAHATAPPLRGLHLIIYDGDTHSWIVTMRRLADYTVVMLAMVAGRR